MWPALLAVRQLALQLTLACLQNAVSTDKGFARVPSLDELAATYTSSKDLKGLLKDTQAR